MLSILYLYLTDAALQVYPDPTLEEINQARECINDDDAPILAVAIKTEADCIVIGNTRHFSRLVAECAKIAIFTPAEYLAGLVSEP
ncbi:MAG: hypothetical protein EXR50_03230 [Dehalococcoidia bacterium]|nr:hypothetical protein [Dehalococcoidia bacterium]